MIYLFNCPKGHLTLHMEKKGQDNLVSIWTAGDDAKVYTVQNITTPFVADGFGVSLPPVARVALNRFLEQNDVF